MSAFPKTTRNEQNYVKPKVRKILTDHGWFWWITPANMYGRTGVSDYCAIKSGMFMAIETKFGKNDPTPMQMAYLGSVRAEQHFGFIVRENTLDAFATFLDLLDETIRLWPEKPPEPVAIGMAKSIKTMIDTEILDPFGYEKKLKATLAKHAKDKTHVPV